MTDNKQATDIWGCSDCGKTFPESKMWAGWDRINRCPYCGSEYIDLK